MKILRSKADLLEDLDQSILECEQAYREGMESKEDQGMLLLSLKAQIATLKEIRTRVAICCVNWTTT